MADTTRDFVYCECATISVSSSGGAGELYPHYMGEYVSPTYNMLLIFLPYFRYTLFSDVWDLVPFWQNAAGVFLWPDEFSSPDTNHIKWVFDDTIETDVDGKIMNDVYQDDFEKCPFDMDQWKYESGDGDWIIDETLTVTCTSFLL